MLKKREGKKMRRTLWNLPKNKFYEDLAKSLIDAKNNYQDGSIGWAREANLSASSPMNTSEVLLGLLFSSNIITQGSLSKDIRDCVKGGAKYLIKTQCESGGWTTSESVDDKNAQGNIMTTATAIWSIIEYLILHDDLTTVEDCLEKSFQFIKACKLSESIYKFRPVSDKYSIMSTLYALMGLVNLNMYFFEKKDSQVVQEIIDMVDNIIKNLQIDKCSSFEIVFLMLVLKKMSRFDKKIKYCPEYKDVLNRVQIISQNLEEKDYTQTYCDIRYIRENGEKTEFFYFTPAWVLSSVCYGISTFVPYKDQLIGNIVNEYFFIEDEIIKIKVHKREWTWATAQILMAFSMYGTTQSIGDFLNLEEERDSRSAFIVYGRNLKFKNSIEACLRAIGIKPKSYQNDGADARSTFEAVYHGMNETAISIVLLTGDDEGKCNSKYLLDNDKTKPYEKKITPQPRMNVVFEAGYSYALRNNKNTIIITTNVVRPFTDLDGVNKIVLDLDKKGNPIPSSVSAFKNKLVQNLNNCGCKLSNEAIDILKEMPINI